MMDPPDEIVEMIINSIIEPDPDYIYHPGDQTPEENFVKITSRLYNVNRWWWNPIFLVSMVNRRFRRICLPILFQHMLFAPYEDRQKEETERSETELFSNVLGHHAHLARFVRHVRMHARLIDDKLQPTHHHQLIVDTLAKFPNLELVELEGSVTIHNNGDWAPEILTVIEAANRHPNSSLRIVYFDSMQLSNFPPPISLSRMVLSHSFGGDLADLSQHLDRGLGVMSLAWLDGDQYTKTYPGLEELDGVVHIPPKVLSDFLKRHPKLKKVTKLIMTDWVTQTPWGKELQAALQPNTLICSQNIGLEIVRAQRDEWHLLKVTLEFKVTKASDIVDIMSKLALPHVRILTLDFDAGAITDEDLDTVPPDKLVPKNCPNLYSFGLPEVIFRCISRRWYPNRPAENLDTGNSTLRSEEGDVAHVKDLQPFCENISVILGKSLRKLQYVYLDIPWVDVGKYSLYGKQLRRRGEAYHRHMEQVNPGRVGPRVEVLRLKIWWNLRGEIRTDFKF
ncbi:hypothetical protein VKT23_013764 [Stygiomarasmius scandens]|uniref:F-box domain-containing protein n=1 Tax=Marasmiellus scandens TaxID=2682957 RepID=A0ABR1J3R4_9AGAR